MKLPRNLAVILTVCSLVALRPAFAIGANSVVLTNSTGYTIYMLYASSSGATAWDTTNNLLGSQTVAPAQQVTVNIPSDSSGSCLYDLMAVLYGTNQYAYQYSVNVCTGAAWTIK